MARATTTFTPYHRDNIDVKMVSRAGVEVYYKIKRIKGKYYLYECWYNDIKKQPDCHSIGNIEWLKQLAQQWRKQHRRKRLQLTKKNAGPRGFEPRTTGLGEQISNKTQREFYPSNGFFNDSSLLDKFMDWLLSKMEEDTARYYLNIIRRYGRWIPANELKRKERQAFRKFIQFLFENALIDYDMKLKLLDHYKLGGQSKQKKGHKWIEDSTIINMYDRTSDIYRIVFRIGYFSGARLAHVLDLLNTWNPNEKLLHPNDLFEPRLYCNELFCRYFIYIRRGRKPCDYIYFPKQLLEEIETIAGKKQLVYTSIKNWYSKHNIEFGLLRKYFEQRAKQTCKKHNIPHDAVKFILTRELSVSGAHYDDTRRWADQLYSILVKKLIEVIGFG